jgi:competence protein ComEA
MKIFNKISEKTGFSITEIKVIIFLVTVLFVGYGYKTFSILKEKTFYEEYNYYSQDSLFYSKSNTNEEANINTELTNSKKNYKNEVLELSKENYSSSVKKSLPSEKSIDLNKAGINELTKLPGIGTKTAEKIIEFRKTYGNFTNLEALLKVKGIGNSKLTNIKKYLYIKSP